MLVFKSNKIFIQKALARLLSVSIICPDESIIPSFFGLSLFNSSLMNSDAMAPINTLPKKRAIAYLGPFFGSVAI